MILDSSMTLEDIIEHFWQHIYYTQSFLFVLYIEYNQAYTEYNQKHGSQIEGMQDSVNRNLSYLSRGLINVHAMYLFAVWLKIRGTYRS